MLNKLTLTEALAGLRAKKFTSVELVQACLDQIKKLNPKLNAFLAINEKALDEAKKADLSKPLGGIPIAIKDNFLTMGLPTTASSKVLEGYIIIGKTNMDAWAHGSSTESSDFGPTLNPWNTNHLPGGSSGGSAAAVAADMCIAAIGSETAGSVRQPAAWCGVTGFKPTYGRVSRYGVIAMASSTDSPGPITKTVEDAAILAQIIAGHDPFDATSSPLPVGDYISKLKTQNSKLKIGLAKEYLVGQSKSVVSQAAEKLKELGHEVSEISLLDPKYSIGVYTIVQRSEVSSLIGIL